MDKTRFDCFSAGLVLKWIFAGVAEKVPYKDESNPEIVRGLLTELSRSQDSLHPFVADLSDIEDHRFHEIIQVFCSSFNLLSL